MIVSAGAIKNHETANANFLNILAEAIPAKETIQIAPDPSGGAWEELIPKKDVNYSTILISSMDPYQFNPDLVFEWDLSNGNNMTQRNYITETDYLNGLIKTDGTDKTQYLPGYYDESITSIDHPIYENKSTISMANSDLRYIYEDDLELK